MSLFAPPANPALVPLAERVRPRTLADLIGQEHLTGADGPIRRLLDAKALPSLLFWGPPGVGKTTLAQLIASEIARPFRSLSAVQAGVKDVREAMTFADTHPGTVLFIDEIHRFNKAQQDALLQAVEQGRVTLIGATTENPSFEVIGALRSRCQLYILKALDNEALSRLLVRAVTADEILSQRGVELRETEMLFRLSGGDGRKALGLLELVVQQAPADGPAVLTDEAVLAAAQQRVAVYDKGGEYHYDVISAFIKSVRGGDPNAALYYLARMIDAGEDPLFIARRLVILASEDIGNANPNGLLLANAAFQAVSVIGMPEGRIVLGQCTTYLATSLKSNASYGGINAALDYVRQHPDGAVPLHLRNGVTGLMKGLGYGQGYKYSHEYEGVEGNQDYFPEGTPPQSFYKPKPIGKEREITQFMREKWGERYKT